MPQRTRLIPLLCVLALGGPTLGGCASGPEAALPVQAPQRQLPALYQRPPEVRDPLYVADPLESTNRQLYKFNAKLDDYVLIPVVDAYEAVTPGFVRTRVSNFFLNLGEVNTFLNSVLQLRVTKAAPTLARFVINSTVGVFGLFDVATDLEIKRENEDFGQTLGYWGMAPGPYLVLPALGPSNLRDGVGRVVDWVAFDFVLPDGIQRNDAYAISSYTLQPIDARARVPFRYHETGSPFEYELVRYGITKAREVQIKE